MGTTVQIRKMVARGFELVVCSGDQWESGWEFVDDSPTLDQVEVRRGDEYRFVSRSDVRPEIG